MSLVTETGTADALAESYCSAIAADTYHANRGNTAWAALTTQAKEIALRLATDYMTQSYRDRWEGTRRTLSQALDWPRVMVKRRDSPMVYGSSHGYVQAYYDAYSVPDMVVYACAELALRSLTQQLLPDTDRKTLAESVGPLSITYAPGSSQLIKFNAVENLLTPVLKGGRGVVRLGRG